MTVLRKQTTRGLWTLSWHVHCIFCDRYGLATGATPSQVIGGYAYMQHIHPPPVYICVSSYIANDVAKIRCNCRLSAAATAATIF